LEAGIVSEVGAVLLTSKQTDPALGRVVQKGTRRSVEFLVTEAEGMRGTFDPTTGSTPHFMGTHHTSRNRGRRFVDILKDAWSFKDASSRDKTYISSTLG
jgi:hypothetical protein